MAGWSKRVGGSGLECLRSHEKPQEKPASEVGVKDSRKEVEGEKINTEIGIQFNKFVSHLLKEAHGPRCFRPMPPMLGNEKAVELFKLYVVVRGRGGYRAVSRSGQWDVVAKECGFDFRAGLPLKLVYAKYLDSLDRWLQKHIKEREGDARLIDMDVGGISMGIEPSFLDIIGKILEMETGSEIVNADLENSNTVADRGNEPQSVTNKANISVKCGKDDNRPVSTLPKEEDNVGRKRKLESCLDMLNWVLKVAKDPSNPSIKQLPDVSKWKSYGTDEMWKQVLVLRESMLLKRDTSLSHQNSVWQRSQRIHPTMYEDRNPPSDRVRCSPRLVFAKDDSSKKKRTHLATGSTSTSVQSDDDPSDTQFDSTEDLDVGRWWNLRRRQRTPVGPNFQADIPEWTGEITESDSKWLGFQIWPLPKGEKRGMFIERESIGKGRRDSCGCRIPGSLECVKFHIAEKRLNLKYELGSAFYLWKLDCAGEDVALLWTKGEEKKFEDIVKSESLASQSKSFWDEIFKQFPRKSRGSLVSYHFNVFLLRRRAHQNRFTPTEIDSDDDDEQCGPRANFFGREGTKPSNSIFCSPKK
ncbi:unnamed protein product [Cuscuta campestris]|uniref:ARID domain-containing protein n=1 Tax=Cuscuta campestris TaxID=132261 RepID=A0A484N0S0_9ASTE|nr:unnamed protein product [Cuscuta campestris]